MKAITVLKIFNDLTEDSYKVNEKRIAKGTAPLYYNITITTANREYKYSIDDESNWEVDTDENSLRLDDNEGTRWIDTDKIESITL